MAHFPLSVDLKQEINKETIVSTFKQSTDLVGRLNDGCALLVLPGLLTN